PTCATTLTQPLSLHDALPILRTLGPTRSESRRSPQIRLPSTQLNLPFFTAIHADFNTRSADNPAKVVLLQAGSSSLAAVRERASWSFSFLEVSKGRSSKSTAESNVPIAGWFSSAMSFSATMKKYSVVQPGYSTNGSPAIFE